MSIPRNTDVKKHLARSIPRFVTKEKDSDKPLPILVEPAAPGEYSKTENDTKSEHPVKPPPIFLR